MSRGRRHGRIPWGLSLAALAVCLLVSIGFVMFRDAAVPSTIEGETLSWRFRLRGPLPPPPELAIIAIDDATVAAVRGWPPQRRILAEAVSRLHEAGAAVIGLDLLLIEPEPPSDGSILSPGDRLLLEALRDAGNTVLTFAFTFEPRVAPNADSASVLQAASFGVVEWPGGAGGSALIEATGALLPIAPLPRVAGIGHANVPVERDGEARLLPVAIGYDDLVVPAFPVEVARRFLGLQPSEMALSIGDSLHLGARTIALDTRTRLPLNFYGPDATIETFSLIDLLENRVPTEKLAGRIVLIGAAALGVGDSFATPFSRNLRGVEVLGTAVGNLLGAVGSSRVDLQACKLEYSIVSPK